jgi:aspartate aminotransferase
LMQRALPHVLGHPDGTVDVGIYADNCKRMADTLRELGFSLRDPKAGFFLFPGLPEAMRTAEGGDIALTEALREARCVVVPGTAFGRPNFLRLSMCVNPETVDGAIAALKHVCP